MVCHPFFEEITTHCLLFQVVATDNGNPKHFARTTVHIKLKDYNDNAPIFVDGPYEASVKENALPGTVLVKLSTADKDVDMNTSVDFYITAGDPRSQFQVCMKQKVCVPYLFLNQLVLMEIFVT